MRPTDPVPQALPDPPVAMFSAPGHPDTVWSDVKGSVAHSRMIRWAGGVAATHAIDKVSGAAEVRTRSVELHFSWNAGIAEAEAESGKRVWAYRNRPRYGLILPPGTNVEFRIKEKSNYRFLAMEFEPAYLLRAAELAHLNSVEFVETWEQDRKSVV
jgi:AraC family transcriptional regulator